MVVKIYLFCFCFSQQIRLEPADQPDQIHHTDWHFVYHFGSHQHQIVYIWYISCIFAGFCKFTWPWISPDRSRLEMGPSCVHFCSFPAAHNVLLVKNWFFWSKKKCVCILCTSIKLKKPSWVCTFTIDLTSTQPVFERVRERVGPGSPALRFLRSTVNSMHDVSIASVGFPFTHTMEQVWLPVQLLSSVEKTFLCCM